jgi:DNA-binding cell septation regulator SpoVG
LQEESDMPRRRTEETQAPEISSENQAAGDQISPAVQNMGSTTFAEQDTGSTVFMEQNAGSTASAEQDTRNTVSMEQDTGNTVSTEQDTGSTASVEQITGSTTFTEQDADGAANAEQDSTARAGHEASQPSFPQEQEQTLPHGEHSDVIPLNAKITSLEMDGNTRAFATVNYGDLTIHRIRVKEDEFGSLSVAMPKFRQPGGWEETCSFNTTESRNRLTNAVLDAYDQQIMQMQEQPIYDRYAPEQAECPGFDSQDSGGMVMSMSQ